MVQCAGVRAAAVTLARLSRPCRVFGARNQTCSRAGHPALLSVLWQQSFPMSSKTRVLATSHAAQQGPVDEWLVAQVDIIVSAMPAMQGPPDQASLKQLMRAAENLDSSRSLRIEFPEPNELDMQYTEQHQPKITKALKAASLEALPLEKRVAVLRGTFTSILSKFSRPPCALLRQEQREAEVRLSEEQSVQRDASSQQRGH